MAISLNLKILPLIYLAMADADFKFAILTGVLKTTTLGWRLTFDV
jgi:hypothetical protein